MNIMRSTNDIKHSYGCGIQGPHTFERSVNLYKDFSDQLGIFWKKTMSSNSLQQFFNIIINFLNTSSVFPVY